MVRPNKNNIKICPRCKGNGYITVPNKSVEEIGNSITIGCPMCDNLGEIDDPNDTIIIDADGIHRLQWICNTDEWQLFGYESEYLCQGV